MPLPFPLKIGNTQTRILDKHPLKNEIKDVKIKKHFRTKQIYRDHSSNSKNFLLHPRIILSTYSEQKCKNTYRRVKMLRHK